MTSPASSELVGGYTWPARPQPVSAQTASILLASGRYALYGWGLVNNGAGAGTVNIYDGVDAKGTLVIPLSLAAGAQSFFWLSNPGIELRIGCYLQLATVTLQGSVFLTPLVRVGQPRPPTG